MPVLKYSMWRFWDKIFEFNHGPNFYMWMPQRSAQGQTGDVSKKYSHHSILNWQYMWLAVPSLSLRPWDTMVHASALHSVNAKYLNLELSTGNFGGLRMGVCSTATTAVKLGRRATWRVWRAAGHVLDGCGEFMPSLAGDPASLRYAAVPQVGRDSRALHSEEMPEDCSRSSSTARLRRRISATIFFAFFASKINILFLSMYIHLFIHLLQTSI